MHSTVAIPTVMFLPFFVLLMSIAILPLAAPHFWEKNRNQALVSGVLALPVLIFLVLNYGRQLNHALEEYLSFIILLAALFIITGGIVITTRWQGTPGLNTAVLLTGAILANFIGTTGASMLLIRPLLQMNRERQSVKHLIVFFIFLVSNIGGALTPLGDPPLFLGYLRGVPFGWNLQLLPHWLVGVGVLLGLFYGWDCRQCRREGKTVKKVERFTTETVRVAGGINFLFLTGVLAAVFFQFPAGFRELTMVAMAGLSWVVTKKEMREINQFSFHPLIEVAVLFAGIFITMVPLMMLLETHGAAFGITKPGQYFWLVGGLSSFLDNAPTYATFFALAENVTRTIGSQGVAVIAGVRSDLLVAISCGAVFMGANTYIGNGPNFMVKAIAERQGFKAPHFFEYLAYSGLILIPLFGVVTWLFFR